MAKTKKDQGGVQNADSTQKPAEETKETQVEELGASIMVKKLPKGLKRVKVDEAELMRLQAECSLVGYDPRTKEAIVKE